MTEPIISLDAHWQPASLLTLPAALSPWLLEQASLTARLKRHCQHFRVQVLHEANCSLPDFLRPLLGNAEQALLREVILWCNDKPCVYAQSWLPDTTIEKLTPLAQLGERPLGDYIFQHQGLRRGSIEATQLDVLLPQFHIATRCFTRRSVFQLQDMPLLVSEAFLPAISHLTEAVA